MHTLLLLFSLTLACKQSNCTSQQTAWFKNNWRGNPAEVWVNLSFSDPCEIITNRKLRSEFPSEVHGREIDHMVETANDYPEYAHCSRNIRGNLVAVNPTWNKQVGNLCCPQTDAEKNIVYGQRYKQAVYYVTVLCCGNRTVPPQPPGNPADLVIILIGLFALVLVFIGYVSIRQPAGNDDYRLVSQDEQSV